MNFSNIVNLANYPIDDPRFMASCKSSVDEEGVLVIPDFLTKAAIAEVHQEGIEHQDKAYFCNNDHNVYLGPSDPNFADDHPRNRLVVSSKGCISDDVVPEDSPLKTLYDSDMFRGFISHVFGEEALYDYADDVSSVNLHYAKTGQELGWHFDNSTFSITLMIEEPEQGGTFEYITGVRNAGAGEMNFEGVGKILDGDCEAQTLSMNAGALVLFRGQNSIHRVTPNLGERTRMMVVLAYNSVPGVALSEEARRTFYGKL